MHDIVIRGGTIIDGTGRAAFTGDVAIGGGRIAAVGGKAGPARREIDAAGLLVTPGWVDVHTHYDGQAMWDPLLAPSCWHGVTTVVFGNCGVGFAPVKKHHRQALMDLMEGVEEIPNPVLTAGLTWEWESFPDFMDALDRRERVGPANAAPALAFSARRKAPTRNASMVSFCISAISSAVAGSRRIARSPIT
jgi:N-acyl-D-amino-acid deacylase